ncbi:MAG: DEAD/DEAH box helicase [Methanobrevibacter sp.]|jgi:DNA helicase-2/ATP-dependent DNA helicase PcrA|nr:DEAD/DEAH box helicase [Candidatus Methanovirga basalitermitum]
MIDYEQFKEFVINVLKRDIEHNVNQNKAIATLKDKSLFIVAGPGSGKTTVIVLKILKFIFVDDIQPSEIIATTFTNKAAKELYSRILEWGTILKEAILKESIFDENTEEKLNRIDFSQLINGTIDSIADELLRIYREPGSDLPIIIEDFVAVSTMIKTGLFQGDRYLNKDLQVYLGRFTNREKVSNPSKMSEILLNMKSRLFYDQADVELLKNNTDDNGAKEALHAISDYEDYLSERNMFDFPMLESFFLGKLNSNSLDDFLNDIKVILVDEYQDTNLIQEMIYFRIAEATISNGGNITVVGDDDQSVYRFRGATVDLFTNFKKRIKKKLNVDVDEVNLSTNYRSTEDIIGLCNHFVELDDEYQDARVSEKPKIEDAKIRDKTIPILGMFRSDEETLARDLSILIRDLIENREVKREVKRVLKPREDKKHPKKIAVSLNEEYGSHGDIAVLTYSPKEYSFGNPLFPYHLRKYLKHLKNPIPVFNPRGQNLHEIECVAILCGLILECIDSKGRIQKRIKKLPKIANVTMKKWRKKANNFMDLSPTPNTPLSLRDFVNHWMERVPYDEKNSSIKQWPKTTSLIDLTYKLIIWLPGFQDNPKGLVYLGVITKTINQTGFVNEFSAKIHFDSKDLEYSSIEEAIWNIFVPIATGGVFIDENSFETLPDEHINIMSIHQSKGLEFPFVIVDVGSRFKKNKVKTSFLRFPKDEGEKSTLLEDEIRAYSPIGKGDRSKRNREFDDLTRLYFVAFSRAQDVLMLIGLDSALRGYMVDEDMKKIPNVALGWRRDKEFVGFDEVLLI